MEFNQGFASGSFWGKGELCWFWVLKCLTQELTSGSGWNIHQILDLGNWEVI